MTLAARLLVLGVLVLTAAPLSATGPKRPAALPPGITVVDWKQIRAEYERHRHGAFPDPRGGYHARSFEQQWLAHFDGRGFSATPDNGDWRWGLELAGVVGKAKISVDVNRVTYHWQGLDEWFVNDTRGLEHGFTLQSPREVRLAVRGGLRPRASADGVEFVDASGTARIRYTGLVAHDARGRRLPARMKVAEGEVILDVDDAGAQYPVTIDPIAQQAFFKASNPNRGDAFGRPAISGDTIIVGVAGEDSSATGVGGDQSDNSAENSGAVYVFVRSGSTWTQQAYLKASNTEVLDAFGSSVAISGDTIVVGANSEDSNATGVNGNQTDNSATFAGAAYVFVRSGTTWSQQAYLKASNTGANDWFGQSVAISGGTIVVGAYAEGSKATGVDGNQADNSQPGAGAAYVFVRDGSTWTQQAYLKGSGGVSGFGSSLAMSADTVVAGAFVESGQTGAAYVFVRSGAAWSQQGYLKASNAAASDRFGFSVAISGDTMVVGAPQEDSNATGVGGIQTNNSSSNSGAAYVFVRSGGAWSQQAYIKASNTAPDDSFGGSVAISGDWIAVGASGEDSNATGVDGNQADNSAATSGAAYLFSRSGTVWSQQAYVKASNTEANDQFGVAIAMSGNTIVIVASNEDQSGAAYVFTLPPVTVTITSSPTGLSFTTSGTDCAAGTYTSPQTLSWISGSPCTVAFAAQSSGGVGTRYAFNRWEDNSTSATRSVTAPPSATTYTATFDTEYLLEVAASPSAGGTVSGGGYHTAGSNAGVSQTANPGYAFAGWTGACSGNGACSVTMNAPKTVTAQFGVSITIASSPAGLSFTTSGAGCSPGTYTSPQTLGWIASSSCSVTFSTPQNGAAGVRYVFQRWEDNSTSAARTVTAPGSETTYTATFLTQYQLTSAANPSNGGTVSQSGFFNSGAAVTAIPQPASGYTFTGWSGACTGMSPCALVMDAPKTITANFNIRYALNVAVSPANAGTATGTVNGAAFSCSTTCSTLPGFGDVITLTAAAVPGYTFTSWSGCDSTAGTTCTVTMNAARNVVATITPAAGTLTFTAGPLALDRTTGRYRRTITVTNPGGAVANAAFVTDNLAAGVSLYGQTGVTAVNAPLGSPYIDIGAIGANSSKTVTIQFTRTGSQTITYTGRVLGDGPR